MMLTEEQAKEKWCPFTRMSSVSGLLNRVGSDLHPNTRCIASECMAWRAVENTGRPLPGGGYEFTTGTGGYCGLAGKP